MITALIICILRILVNKLVYCENINKDKPKIKLSKKKIFLLYYEECNNENVVSSKFQHFFVHTC